MKGPVSSKLIFEAMEYYQNIGFAHCTVPIFVSSEVSDFTRPFGNEPLKHNDMHYVGSAEQSFLQLIRDKKLPRGHYQALTPCFRVEDAYDETHLKMFLKLELINVGCNDRGHAPLMKSATAFFNGLGLKVHTEKTDIGFDIIHSSSNIELGSYGIRTFDDIMYAYGTGIAEPRTSICLNKET